MTDNFSLKEAYLVKLQGIRDDLAQFIIEKHPEKGYVSLQSNVQRGLYMGMKPDGRIWPTVDTGVNNIWFYPEVVECKLWSIMLTHYMDLLS